METYKEITGNLALPPSPVVTRWGTWLEAVKFYATNLDAFTKVISEFDETESKAISECNELLSNYQLCIDVPLVTDNFGIIFTTIEKLESRGLTLSKTMQLVEDVKEKLDGFYEKTFVNKLIML